MIKDVIHRFINVSNLCKAFIDTPEFNRLRKIKQLGLVYLVYPSAVQTRFEHSIGVMHLAGKVADHFADSITQREKELLMLAGLLHDVGHVALSHLLDYFLEENKIDEQFSKHENRSCFLVKKMNTELGLLNEREVEMVCKMIKGDIIGEEKPFLFEIINNKRYGVDVDRLDYLQRDLYHLSMPCFQPDYILECLKIKDGRLAILEKARPEIEMLYEARKRLLTLVCRHKTVIKFENVFRDALNMLNINGEWFKENWLNFDDYSLDVMMREKCPELLKSIYTRSLRQWNNNIDEQRYMHIQDINRQDINRQLSLVFWIN